MATNMSQSNLTTLLHHRGIEADHTRRRSAHAPEVDYTQCCFCGKPAEVWKRYPLPPTTGHLPLVEMAEYAMCGTCFEENEEDRAKKGQQGR
jgi:hypothetical protein